MSELERGMSELVVNRAERTILFTIESVKFEEGRKKAKDFRLNGQQNLLILIAAN